MGGWRVGGALGLPGRQARRLTIVTNAERAENYRACFPEYPPLRADDRWIDGVWMLGNNYKGSGYYGAYPPGYLKRIAALFPDLTHKRVLHLFSGSLTPVSPIRGWRMDINAALHPEVCGDAQSLPFVDDSFHLVVADTPYSAADAERYGTRMISRPTVLHEIARIVPPGGVLVWLDTVWPMFSKRDWHCFGVIGIVRSTNHRVRLTSLFERVGLPGR